MKTFRYIVSNLLILNFSVLLWATAMCPCSQTVHDETQCIHGKNSHSSMAHSGNDNAVMTHNMDTNRFFTIVHDGSPLLRNKSCCCQTFDVKKESPVTITPVTLTKANSAEFDLKSGDHFAYDHGLFVPDAITSLCIETPDSNPFAPPIYLLNSAFLI